MQHRVSRQIVVGHASGRELKRANPRCSAEARAFQRVVDQPRQSGVQGGVVVGLSGTPITRDTGDLHPILQALDSGAWAAKERFVKRYCMSIPGEYGDEIGVLL